MDDFHEHLARTALARIGQFGFALATDRTWPLPWVPLTDQNQKQLAAELAAELAPGHSLFGAPCTVVARCRTCDHVVVVTPDTWVVVHLTWKRPDRPPWPDIYFSAESKSGLLIATAEDGHDEGH